MAKKKYDLVGIDGNAFAILGYTQRAMQKEGLSKAEQDKYFREATSGNYDDLIAVSIAMIDMLNENTRN